MESAGSSSILALAERILAPHWPTIYFRVLFNEAL
jgi:hypothetical protein